MISPWLFRTDYLSLHVYGLAIFCGLVLSTFLFSHDYFIKKYDLADEGARFIFSLFVSGVIGGRVVSFLSHDDFNWTDLFLLQKPGYSLMGASLGVLLTAALMVHQNRRYGILLIDRVALYCPLLIAFGRVGCFFTGCCYGTPTALWCGVTYVHEECLAPLGVCLHPTQLYSTVILCAFFGLLYFLFKEKDVRGQLFLLVVIGICAERFVVDFFRDDRTLCIYSFSLHQVLALVCVLVGLTVWYINKHVQRTRSESF